MGGRIIKTKQVSVDDLLTLIGMSCLDEIAQELQSDKWVSKLKSGLVFKLVMYSLLQSNDLSLRVMEKNYDSPVFKAMEATAIGNTAHNSIRDRLVQIDVRFFKQLYDQATRVLMEHFEERYLLHFNLKRYDSTMIRVCSHLLQGMKVGNSSKNKSQVKLTTEFQNDFRVSFSFHKDQSHVAEETALKELIIKSSHQKNDLIVFDRGIKSRKTFVSFKQAEINFVTRLYEKSNYQLLRTHQATEEIKDDKLNFVQDSIVYLYGHGNKVVEEEFRLIEAITKDGNKLFFLTTILDLPTEQIAAIYKMRWDIEVLFRFMKQEMNLTHLVCNQTNAIEVMLYITLITAMLVLVYKKKNELSSYKIAKIQFFKELEAAILLHLSEDPERWQRFNQNLKKYIQKN